MTSPSEDAPPPSLPSIPSSQDLFAPDPAATHRAYWEAVDDYHAHVAATSAAAPAAALPSLPSIP